MDRELKGAVIESYKPSGDNTIRSVIVQTKDYSKFNELEGNRAVDLKHVKRIQANMLNVGNLTSEFPIVVNENLEVIDGQHRLAALRELGWPVFYRIQEGLSLATVRGINQAGQNWSWRDYASSFAKQGKANYQVFLDLSEKYSQGYGVISIYLGMPKISGNSRTHIFNQGELKIVDIAKTRKLLDQYQEVSTMLGHDAAMFAQAMYNIMRNPNYDHQHMLHKITVNNTELHKLGTVNDYLRFIENVYNYKVSEENRVRLY